VSKDFHRVASKPGVAKKGLIDQRELLKERGIKKPNTLETKAGAIEITLHEGKPPEPTPAEELAFNGYTRIPRRWAVECMNHDGEWLSLGDYSCREHASQVVERATVLPDVAEVRMVEPDAPLRIDESRLGVPATGVFVRAETGPSGKVGSVDIAHLDHSSLRRWLEAAEGRAADVVLILLGHGGQ
jgi:hypothetical protein